MTRASGARSRGEWRRDACQHPRPENGARNSRAPAGACPSGGRDDRLRDYRDVARRPVQWPAVPWRRAGRLTDWPAGPTRDRLKLPDNEFDGRQMNGESGRALGGGLPSLH